MSGIPGNPVYQIARLIELSGSESGRWCVLLKADQDAESFVEEFSDELEVQTASRPRVIAAGDLSVDQFLKALHRPADDVVLITGFEKWRGEAMRALDINRNRAERPGFVVFWLLRSGAERLLRNAPNIWSWIGGCVFAVEPDPGLMSEKERQKRLAALSRHYHLNNEKVVQMAQDGTLPADPEFTEWLILMGRPDLAG